MVRVRVMEDQLARLEKFRAEHPGVDIRPPLASFYGRTQSGMWAAFQDGVVIAVRAELKDLLDRLEFEHRALPPSGGTPRMPLSRDEHSGKPGYARVVPASRGRTGTAPARWCALPGGGASLAPSGEIMETEHEDAVVRHQRFKEKHPEVEFTSPVDGGGGFWIARRDGIILAVKYELSTLLDQLELMGL